MKGRRLRNGVSWWEENGEEENQNFSQRKGMKLSEKGELGEEENEEKRVS